MRKTILKLFTSNNKNLHTKIQQIEKSKMPEVALVAPRRPKLIKGHLTSKKDLVNIENTLGDHSKSST